MEVSMATLRQDWFDRLAIGASTLCLLHCLALPALLVAVPALSVLLAVPEGFHVLAFALAVPTSAAALGLGHCRHRRMRPALVALLGLAAIGIGALGRWSGAAETAITVAGSLLLAAGHTFNARAMRHR
jgi:hypothetical protein